MASNPFFLSQGTLYKIPTTEKEHGQFRIDMSSTEVKSTSRPLHPNGGHNYYGGRDMEKLQRRLKSIAKDLVKRVADTEEPYRRDSASGQIEMRSSDVPQRRYSSGSPSQATYNNLHPTSAFKDRARSTSVDRRPRARGTVVLSGLIAPFGAGMFRRQSSNHAAVVNASDNPIPSVEITPAEPVQDAHSDSSGLASLTMEETYPLPLPPGPVQKDPPWVALYLARERAEDQLWEEKLTRSVWGTLRGVVGFGAAGKANDESEKV